MENVTKKIKLESDMDMPPPPITAVKVELEDNATGSLSSTIEVKAELADIMKVKAEPEASTGPITSGTQTDYITDVLRIGAVGRNRYKEPELVSRYPFGDPDLDTAKPKTFPRSRSRRSRSKYNSRYSCSKCGRHFHTVKFLIIHENKPHEFYDGPSRRRRNNNRNKNKY